MQRSIELATSAGQAIMRIYQGPIDARHKADKSPVTDADHAAEAVILEGLQLHFPDIPIISEEAFAAGTRPAVGDRFFLVDPLDGTKEFLSRNGEFTVNIALIEHGVAVLGVVYAPARERLFSGEVGGGAFEHGKGAPHPLRVRKAPAGAIIAVASRSHNNPQTEEFLSRYKIAQRVEAGSSLKFCLIAAGEADLYPRLGPTMEWDTAAGHAVLAAAGGRVLTLDGTPLLYGKVSEGFRNPTFLAEGDLGTGADK